ncbi:Uncharacterized protein Fot_32283 [Forsythia ovata]|uniref:Uncharacterized protein n=1 Tax=Forsythia ovata TaxID=205694 RepID=A0ABD1T7C5_9LAMI
MFLGQQIGRLVEATEVRNNVIPRTDLPGYSIPEIMQVFESLPGVEKGNEFWLLGCQLLENKVKREMFSTVKEPAPKSCFKHYYELITMINQTKFNWTLFGKK